MRIFSSIRVACWALLPMILAGGFAQGATLQTLYPAATPLSGLVSASDGNFYGTSRYGGSNDLGTVFKIATSGSFSLLASLVSFIQGAEPVGGLVVGPDNALYGTTSSGGLHG